ncbi:hypothetical protein HOP50_14g72160 [Chloropicon primus]|nr:hypothetical protein HOP50_14g72160 [Chloropicon primus]
MVVMRRSACRSRAAAAFVVLAALLLLSPWCEGRSSSRRKRSSNSSSGVAVKDLFEVCDDREPRGGHSCGKQASWGKCTEQWFIDGRYCRKTCGLCKEFDPRRTELELRGSMNRCGVKDKQRASACLDAVQGKSMSELTVRSKGLKGGPGAGKLSIEELVVSGALGNLVEDCNVACIVKHSSDLLVHAVIGNFLSEHEAKSAKLEDVLTVDVVSRVFLDFFKHVGCSTEQFVAIVPKLYKILLEHVPVNDRDLLGKIYQIQGYDEASNTTISYTSTFGSFPSASTCLAKSLKMFLSVRKCDGGGGGYHCYRGGR